MKVAKASSSSALRKLVRGKAAAEDAVVASGPTAAAGSRLAKPSKAATAKGGAPASTLSAPATSPADGSPTPVAGKTLELVLVTRDVYDERASVSSSQRRMTTGKLDETTERRIIFEVLVPRLWTTAEHALKRANPERFSPSLAVVARAALDISVARVQASSKRGVSFDRNVEQEAILICDEFLKSAKSATAWWFWPDDACEATLCCMARSRAASDGLVDVPQFSTADGLEDEEPTASIADRLVRSWISTIFASAPLDEASKLLVAEAFLQFGAGFLVLVASHLLETPRFSLSDADSAVSRKFSVPVSSFTPPSALDEWLRPRAQLAPMERLFASKLRALLHPPKSSSSTGSPSPRLFESPSSDSGARWIGFDMDHTLIEYDDPAVDRVIFDAAAAYLGAWTPPTEGTTAELDAATKRAVLFVKPEEYMGHLSFTGVALDVSRGNVLRLDTGGYPRVTYHGRQVSETAYAQGGTPSVMGAAARAPEELGGTAAAAAAIVAANASLRVLYTSFERSLAAAFAAAVHGADDVLSHQYCTFTASALYASVFARLSIAFVHAQSHFSSTGLHAQLATESGRNRLIKRMPHTLSWLKRLKEGPGGEGEEGPTDPPASPLLSRGGTTGRAPSTPRRRRTYLFVLTDAKFVHAQAVMTHAFGPEWLSLFDLVFVGAKKSRFFLPAALDPDEGRGMRSPYGSMKSPQSSSSIDPPSATSTTTGSDKVCNVNGGEGVTMDAMLAQFSAVAGDDPATRQIYYFGDHAVKDVQGPNLHGWFVTAVCNDMGLLPGARASLDAMMHRDLALNKWRKGKTLLRTISSSASAFADRLNPRKSSGLASLTRFSRETTRSPMGDERADKRTSVETKRSSGDTGKSPPTAASEKSLLNHFPGLRSSTDAGKRASSGEKAAAQGNHQGLTYGPDARPTYLYGLLEQNSVLCVASLEQAAASNLFVAL